MAVLCLLLVVLCATTSRAAGVGGRARIRAGALSSERHEAGALAGAVRARADAARDAAGHAAELSTLNEPMTLDCSGATPTSTNSWSVTKLSAWRDLDFYESLLNLFQDSHTNFKSLHNFRYLKMVTCLYTGESNSAHQFLVGHGGKKKQQPKYVAGPALPPVRVMVLLNFKGEGEHAEFKGGFVVGDTEHSMKGATLRLKGYRLASKRATDNPTGRGNVKVQRSSSILKVRFKPDATGRSPTDEAKKVFHYAIEYGQPAITYVSGESEGSKRGWRRAVLCLEACVVVVACARDTPLLSPHAPFCPPLILQPLMTSAPWLPLSLNTAPKIAWLYSLAR